MELLRRLHDRWGFTPGETRTIVLLGLTFLAGAVIRSVRGKPDESAQPDYRVTDSLFSALSNADRWDHDADAGGTTAPVNINSAGRAELMRLPGIGAAYAERIIDYRMRNGSFDSIEQLMRVRGIGPKTLARLRPHVCLGPQ
jgi:comEA protein